MNVFIGSHDKINNEVYLDEFAKLKKNEMLFALNLYYIVYINEDLQKYVIDDEVYYLRYDYHDLDDLDEMAMHNAVCVYNKKYNKKVYHSVFDSMQMSVLFKRMIWFFESIGGVDVIENVSNVSDQGYYYLGKYMGDNVVWFTTIEKKLNSKRFNDKIIKELNLLNTIDVTIDGIGYYNPFECSYIVIRKD